MIQIRKPVKLSHQRECLTQQILLIIRELLLEYGKRWIGIAQATLGDTLLLVYVIGRCAIPIYLDHKGTVILQIAYVPLDSPSYHTIGVRVNLG